MLSFKKTLIATVLYTAINFVNAGVIQDLGLTGAEIKPSPIKDLDVIIADQGIFYITKDQKFLFNGDLLELDPKGPKSINDKFKQEKLKAKAPILAKKLADLKSTVISFPAKQEKYVVSVFFDYTCHYCHELYGKIKEYNDLGITLDFLAFPRAGLESEVAEYMETIYNSKDPVYALSQAEKGNLPSERKKPNIVKKHFDLGMEYGLEGTPALVLPNGTLVSGYLEPTRLLEELKKQK